MTICDFFLLNKSSEIVDKKHYKVKVINCCWYGVKKKLIDIS